MFSLFVMTCGICGGEGGCNFGGRMFSNSRLIKLKVYCTVWNLKVNLSKLEVNIVFFNPKNSNCQQLNVFGSNYIYIFSLETHLKDKASAGKLAMISVRKNLISSN